MLCYYLDKQQEVDINNLRLADDEGPGSGARTKGGARGAVSAGGVTGKVVAPPPPLSQVPVQNWQFLKISFLNIMNYK